MCADGAYFRATRYYQKLDLIALAREAKCVGNKITEHMSIEAPADTDDVQIDSVRHCA